MHIATPEMLFIFEGIIFASVVLLHLVRKNASLIVLYLLQSSAVAALLILSSLSAPSPFLILAILSTVLVKVIIAPFFLFRLIRRHHLKFTSSTYLNSPLTLLIIAAIVALTQTKFFQTLALLAPDSPNLILLSISVILISLLLIINRKGALSQMLGVLSVENGIVSFALFAGLEQNPGLQLGISFIILIWVSIASVFISMIYREFGSLDVTAMKRLTER